MAVPSNTTPATAIVIPSLPFSHSQRIDDGATAYTTYYKYTTLAGRLGIGAFAYENPDVNNFIPVTTVLQSDGVTAYFGLGSGSQGDRFRFGMSEFVTVYFKVTPTSVLSFPCNLTFDAYEHPSNAVQTGDILVNDDSVGLPGIIIRPDGSIVNIAYPMPSGEGGDILIDGSFLLNDFNTQELRFFDNQFNLLSTVNIGNSFPVIRTCIGAQLFYVVWDAGATLTCRSYNRLGVQQSTVSLAKSSFLAAAAINDESEILVSGASAGDGIERYNATTGALIGTLVAGAAGRYIVDILILPDDTILYSSDNQSTGALDVIHISAAGALLNTYSFTTNNPAFTFPRIAYAANNGGTSFWVWLHGGGASSDPDGISRFQEIRVSDGTILQNFTVVEYESGIYQPATDGLGNFGVSFSCPFIVMGDNNTITVNNSDSTLFVNSETPINDKSGIYKIDPKAGKKNDTLWVDLDLGTTEDVKIPDPFVRFPGIGD